MRSPFRIRWTANKVFRSTFYRARVHAKEICQEVGRVCATAGGLCIDSKLGQTEHFRSLADGASRADTMTAHGTFNVYLNNHHPPSKKPSPIPSFAPCLTESVNSPCKESQYPPRNTAVVELVVVLTELGFHCNALADKHSTEQYSVRHF